MERARLTRRLALALTLTFTLAPTTGAASGPAPPSDANAPASLEPGSLEALRAELRRLTAILGDGQGPAQTRACETNTEGVCVYRSRRKKGLAPGAAPPTTPTTRPETRALITTYQAYLEHPDAAAAPDRAAARYHLAKLLIETDNTDDAITQLERVTESDPDLQRAAWAATLLIDELILRWTDEKNTLERSLETGEALREQLTRLSALPLWRHDAAEPLRERELWLHAGVRWREAMALQEQGRNARHPLLAAPSYLACGHAFVAIFNDYPEHDRADTLLWNAANCLEAGGYVGAALKTRSRLVAGFPDSVHTERATLYIAESHLLLTRFEQAARWFGRYARRYPGRQDSVEALERVIWIRSAIGPKNALRSAIADYERYYLRRDPRRAGAVSWRGYSPLTDDDEQRRAYAEAYLKRFVRKGGLSRYVVVSATLAKLLWDRTCRASKPEAGLCVDRGRISGIRSTEARKLPVPSRLTARRRVDDELAKAIALARAAIISHEHHERTYTQEDRHPNDELRAALAGSQLILADARFERLIETTAGRGEDDDPRVRPWRTSALHELRSHERAEIPRDKRLSWVAGIRGEQADAVDELDRAYASIEGDGPSRASATACVRRAQLREWLFRRFERPVACGQGDSRECKAGYRFHAALRASAREAYRRCVMDTPRWGASAELLAFASERHLRLGGGYVTRVDEMVPETRWVADPEPVRAGVITDYETAALLGQTIE